MVKHAKPKKNQGDTPKTEQFRLSDSLTVTAGSHKPKISLRPQLTQLAAKGNVEALEQLLEEGVDVESPSPNGSTALVVAAKYGQLQAIKILLKHGAKAHRAAIEAAQEAGHPQIVVQIASAMLRES
jgi:ankyrin repeat protein